ncbi:hypothetical protein [Anaeromyxobacter oryzae]|uniref:DUF2892 domain-containing protein n=1 Tax=Anaeromyxobacter oryzae TaxID=2918170 RepID=A0ABM7X1I0_9BACT|nr:hypothetical protein [Anaeromyxobacter oryzae]BDG05643.1 hypothetical protein AMOR_46390 [Anaeromyxobacter oryzae]
MSLHETFNRSAFSQFINGPTGRIFRLVAGTGFLVFGYAYRGHALGLLSMAWSVLPLSAGAFDVCYISAALGGPFSGARIRGLTRGGGPRSARSSDEASLARAPGSGAHDHPAAR